MAAISLRPHELPSSSSKLSDLTFYLTTDTGKTIDLKKHEHQQHEILIKSSSKATKPDPFRWTTFQSYASGGIGAGEKLVSPRHQHEKLGSYSDLGIHESLQTWMDNNISSYVSHPNEWSERMYPSRICYIYGMEGNGKITCVANFCQKKRINLLFVKPYFIDSFAFLEYTTLAKEKQPCIIYFDNATSLISDTQTTCSFIAAIKGDLDPKLHNVWVMLSSDLAPFRTTPLFADFVRDNGSVLYVPLIDRFDIRLDFVIICFYALCGPTFKVETLDDIEWRHVFENIANSAEGCTMREMYQFMHKVFASIRTSVGGPPVSPTPLDFTTAIKNLPCRIESTRQEQMSLVIRDVGADRRRMEDAWFSHTHNNRVIQMRYKDPTPYIHRDEYCPSTPTYSCIQGNSDEYEEDFIFKNNKRQRS